MTNVYGMKSESDMPEAYKDFIQDEGIPCILCHNDSQIQKGVQTTRINQEHFVKDQFIDPNHPQQNPSELHAVKFLKDHSQVLLDWMGAPKNCWLLACEYISNVHNVCADETLGYQIPQEVQHGGLQDISAFLEYCFFEKVFYLDSGQSFPSTKEKAEWWWVGIASNVIDAMTFKILTDDTNWVVHQSIGGGLALLPMPEMP